MGAETMRLPVLARIRLRWLLLAAVVVVLALVVPSLVSVPSGPAVKRLIVSMPPIAQLSATEIRAAAAPAVEGGVLDVNLQAVRKRVEALAWVKQAEVRRVWPHALAIAVTPERPVARWGTEALLDASGDVFTPPSLSGFRALPVLKGPGRGRAALFEDFQHARRALSSHGYQLASFVLNGRGEVTVTLTGGPRIELGNEQPRAMLARFVTVAAPALGTALARAATVDMRYPSGFAVGWKKDGQDG